MLYMKINVISVNNGHSLTEDCQTLSYTLKKLYRKKKILFNYYQFRETNASIADVNIFVGIINYSLFKYAPINIMIIDPHKFHKTWVSALKKMDYIVTKTQYASDIVLQYVDKEKIINLGWKNKNYLETSITKDYSEFLTIAGHSSYRQLDKLLEVWKPEFPKLNVLCGENYLKNRNLEKKEQENIIYLDKYLHTEEFVKLINTHGIHICLSSATSFANTLHLCQTVKSIPITLDCILYNKFITNNYDGFLIKTKKKSKMKYTLGSEYKVDVEDLKLTIEKVIKIQNEDELLLEEMTERNKKNIQKEEMTFDKNMKEFFDKVWDKHKSIPNINPKIEIFEEDFPSVSIITPTYNRRKFFKLSIRNFQMTDYPKDKIEWIIIDDGKEDIQDLLPNDERIKYTKLDNEEPLKVGTKRNIACEKATGEFIVCMDDDDYYLPGSVKFRVASLLHLKKNVVGCSGLGLFEINKIISNVNLSSYSIGYEARVLEHTLGFRKSHWENNKFLDESFLEGKGLLESSIDDYEDIHWEKIGISLKHYNNTNKRMEINGNTNGSHFNINDDVFNLITNIEETADEDKEMIKIQEKNEEDEKKEFLKKDKEFEKKLDKELEDELKTSIKSS